MFEEERRRRKIEEGRSWTPRYKGWYIAVKDDLFEAVLDEDYFMKRPLSGFQKTLFNELKLNFGTEEQISFSELAEYGELLGYHRNRIMKLMNALYKRKLVRKYFQGYFRRYKAGSTKSGRYYGVHYKLAY